MPVSILELFGAQAVPAAGSGGGGLPSLRIGSWCAGRGRRKLLKKLLRTATKRLGKGPLFLGGDAFEGVVQVVGELNLSFDHNIKKMEMYI